MEPVLLNRSKKNTGEADRQRAFIMSRGHESDQDHKEGETDETWRR